MIVGITPVKVGHRQANYIKPLKAIALRGFLMSAQNELLLVFSVLQSKCPMNVSVR